MISRSSKFKKLLLIYIGVVFLIFNSSFLFFPLIVSAADSGQAIDIACSQYQYPWCQDTGGTPAGFVARFYQIALGLIGAAALGVIIYGAILYTVSAGNTSRQQDAKDWITGAVWGVVLLLSAYLILYTINPDLVSLGETQEALNKLVKPISGVGAPAGGTPQGTGSQPSYDDIFKSTGPNGALDEQTARHFVQDVYGITVKGGSQPCAPGKSVGCVSFNGIRKVTLEEINYLGQVVEKPNDGSVIITSVTEGSHATGDYSHVNGYKFDMAQNNYLGNYIKNNFRDSGTILDIADINGKKAVLTRYESCHGDRCAYYVFEPQIRYKEGSTIKTRAAHWDIQVKPKI